MRFDVFSRFFVCAFVCVCYFKRNHVKIQHSEWRQWNYICENDQQAARAGTFKFSHSHSVRLSPFYAIADAVVVAVYCLIFYLLFSPTLFFLLDFYLFVSVFFNLHLFVSSAELWVVDFFFSFCVKCISTIKQSDFLSHYDIFSQTFHHSNHLEFELNAGDLSLLTLAQLKRKEKRPVFFSTVCIESIKLELVNETMQKVNCGICAIWEILIFDFDNSIFMLD